MRQLLNLVYLTSQVMFVRFSHDGKRLASGSKDETVIIWNIEDVSLQCFHSACFL